MWGKSATSQPRSLRTKIAFAETKNKSHLSSSKVLLMKIQNIHRNSTISAFKRRDNSVALRFGKISDNNHRSLASEWGDGNLNSDAHSIWTTITSFSRKNKAVRPSSKNSLIKRNLELLDKVSNPQFRFLKRKRKENGIYSEIRSHLSKMTKITKGSKVSSKTYTGKCVTESQYRANKRSWSWVHPLQAGHVQLD